MIETTCDECGDRVVECDNLVLLDVPAVEYDEAKAPWTIMRLGDKFWASVGNPSPDGRGHVLHEHQREDS